MEKSFESNNELIKTEKSFIEEGVDFVFEQNPELDKIGMKEKYLEYLDSIFPESKVKDIYYHGTGAKEKIESFDFAKSNFAGAVFFTKSMDFAKQFAYDDVRNGVVQGQVLDVRNSFDFSKEEHIESIRPIIKTLIEEKYESSTGIKFKDDLQLIYNGKKIIENPILDDILEHYMWRLQNGSWRIIETDRIIEYISKNYDSIIINERGSANVAVFSPEQIHVLGSKDDLKKFKNFVNN